MGSAAFLNEAINQLANKYLELAQSASGERIPQNRYLDEKQKVKMYLADNNCFGVDLNPVAVELAEVSIWLNALSSDRFIPWLGMQLIMPLGAIHSVPLTRSSTLRMSIDGACTHTPSRGDNCGNSLIGARRQAWSRHHDHRGFKDFQLRRVTLGSATDAEPDAPAEGLRTGEIWHFLLPDHGMAKYDDKVIKARYPDQIASITAWRKGFTRSFDKDDLGRLEQLSAKIDALWQEHTRQLEQLRRKTTDAYSIFGREAKGAATSLAFKDQVLEGELRAKGLKNANAFRRLKLAINYWCALWLWPIDKCHLLPDRDEYLFDLENLLLGDTLAAGTVGEQRNLFAATTEEAEGKAFVDKYGVVNLDLLFQHVPRLKLAQEIADKRKFFHWELEHADIFAAEGGFDVVLGNPPWIKVEWQEGGVLGDYRPLFVLRKFSASKLNQLRGETFDIIPPLERVWREEFEESEGTQNFLNATRNYPLLQGQKANLYKCFLPQAWMIASRRGVVGFLHPEGIYDDPNGGVFREAVYPRLRRHYQFENQMLLFVEVHHNTKFSINVFGTKRTRSGFIHLANLFVPQTIDASLSHDGTGPVPGIKDESDDGSPTGWNTAGHGDRLIPVGTHEMALFTQLYDAPGTPPLQARLPALHARPLLAVLDKLAARSRRLSDIESDHYSTQHWNEVIGQKDGTIRRDTRFARNGGEWVLSGPIFSWAPPCTRLPAGDAPRTATTTYWTSPHYPTTTCPAPTTCRHATRMNTWPRRRGCHGWKTRKWRHGG
jgi:hypothetical protein